MNDHEFIEFIKELLLAPDTVFRKEHVERMLSILAALDSKEASDSLGHSDGEGYDSRIEDR